MCIFLYPAMFDSSFLSSAIYIIPTTHLLELHVGCHHGQWQNPNFYSQKGRQRPLHSLLTLFAKLGCYVCALCPDLVSLTDARHVSMTLTLAVGGGTP